MNNFVVLKNFLPESFLEYYLQKIDVTQSINSKVGNNVNQNKKRRKDIFLSLFDCELLDKYIFITKKKILKEYFNINFYYRERYKIGIYNGYDKGFYNPHTDTQGGMEHRQISMVICLSNENEYEGGYLNFEKLGHKFKFSKGDAIFFNSNILHGVEQVISGTRKVLISFLFDLKSSKLKKNFIKQNYEPLI
jgi:predicted 2-oxoglutarate/Fe(II)-dependent dioxygenase YbiX